MIKKRERSVLDIVKFELKKDMHEKKLILFLMILVVISFSLLAIFLVAKLSLTGYAASVSSKAGTITFVNVYRKIDTEYWGAIYGLALRVPGFTEQLFQEVSTGEINRLDVFFDCIQSNAVGGTEVYASTSPTIDFANLEPATPAMVDAFTGCSGSVQCASNTYLYNLSVMVGTTNISDVPSTYTYRYDGQNDIFDLGILNDSTNLVFVTHIQSVQRSYNYDKLVNFQVLLPVPKNTTQLYYFFTDPYDECPVGGGIGENILANLSGYVFDADNNSLKGVDVNVAGYNTTSDSNGYYFLNFTALPGTYNLFATKTGYDDLFSNVSFSFNLTSVQKNLTMTTYTPGVGETINPYVFGYVTDLDTGDALEDVKVILGNYSDYTNASGFYSFYPFLSATPNPIIALKTGYNNYYHTINFTSSTSIVNHNISMNASLINYNLYETGPYTTETSGVGPGQYDVVPEEVLDKGEDYWISAKEIKKEVRQNTFVEDVVGIYNLRGTNLNLNFLVSDDISDFVKIDKTTATILPDNSMGLTVTIYGTRPLGTYNGTLTISGDIEQTIPISITVVERKFPIEALLTQVDLFDKLVQPGNSLKYKISLQNLLRDQNYMVTLDARIKDYDDNVVLSEDSYDVEIKNSLTLLRSFPIPKNISDGNYVLEIESKYLNLFSIVDSPFVISKPIYLYSFFGVSLWIIFLVIFLLSFILLNFFLYRRYEAKKKRYKVEVDYDTLPKPGDRVAKLGIIAESKVPAYYELDKLTTHCIVAGATGMGKSISAQVIIEEALMNNIAVIVFDPTAQWSGMLRKCTDKKMISFYPKFGLKETDARGFKGNVRQVNNAKQIIDISKHINPGQIQIFSLNKLDPKDMDVFVANVIRQVFKSDPKESPNLKVLVVFDEVHRLLAKFGGSGEGFLQIERACREFRKWGIGVMLISQVLNDFVGEIKANINTEVQTRTLEENDLARIKTKYGDSFLKSLVKAEVGVAMFQNAEYNRGRPYFVGFRPILHSTRRLSDEELEKYNKYNDIVDDFEYQIEQLEAEKLDTFDLKMELKLVKDKVMSGSFSVVEIYLEGLKPRLEKEWEKLGKKPKKKQLELASEEDIKKSVEEAKAERAKIDAKEAAGKKDSSKEGSLENKSKQESESEEIKKNEEVEKKVSPVKVDSLDKKKTVEKSSETTKPALKKKIVEKKVLKEKLPVKKTAVSKKLVGKAQKALKEDFSSETKKS